MLDKESILGVCDLKTGTVFVEEWGDEVGIKALSTKEMLEIDKASNNGEDSVKMLVHTVIRGVVNEHNEHIFKPSDANALLEKSQVPIAKVANEILRLSGFGEDQEEAEKK